MATNWRGEYQLAKIRKAAATDLLRTAVYYYNQHALRISRPNPPPYKDSSKSGEYMKLRTGAGRSGLTIDPTDPAKVEQSLRVRVGFRINVFYMLILELSAKLRRLGLEQTLKDLRPQLSKLLTFSFRK